MWLRKEMPTFPTGLYEIQLFPSVQKGFIEAVDLL